MKKSYDFMDEVSVLDFLSSVLDSNCYDKASCDNTSCKLTKTMSNKDHCDRRKKCQVKRVMFFLAKAFTRCLKFLLGVTVQKLLIIVSIIITLIIWSWEGETYLEKGQKLNPVIVWWTTGFIGTEELRLCPNDLKCQINSSNDSSKEADAYLFYGSNIDFDHLPLPRKPHQIVWGLYHEESPRNTEVLSHNKVLNLFNFSSTFSRHSDVPFPLQYLESLEDITSLQYFVKTENKNSFLRDAAPVLYLQSDCDTTTERDNYVKELMKYIQVDSYGACLNNKELPEKFKEDYLNNLNEDEFLKFVARYKFVVAIENGVCDDYVTEKFWRAIIVGSVPIYFGSPLIRDWLPNNKSALLIEDYPTPVILSYHINKLLKDDSLYEQYLEHKIRRVISNEKLKYELSVRAYQTDVLLTAQKFECFICEKLHRSSDTHIVNHKHYNCPEPKSALSLDVNPENNWVFSWNNAKEKADSIYDKVTLQ